MKTEIRTNERVILTLSKHWFALVAPFFLATILLFFALMGQLSEYGTYYLIGAGLTILWLIYKIVERKKDIWIVTNLRVIAEGGVFSINSKESPLDKINNITYNQPLIGRILNYGHVQIQTAATGGSTFQLIVEKPKLLKDTITKCRDEYMQAHSKNNYNFSTTTGSTEFKINTDISEELTKLHDLKEKGIITDDEFKQRKTKILNS
ncbi:MAG TPA: hypothetical protein DCG75_10745 [Bacteroidales bacterium]|nr:hypothetical protein [Bacteroidales bacterium]